MRRPSLLAISFLALTTPWSSTPVVPGTAAFAREAQVCSGGYYVNVNGKCVHRPVRAERPPPGATAKCRDGTYSFSQNHRGTCSHHGGVAAWL
jgi:hypothetical protein